METAISLPGQSASRLRWDGLRSAGQSTRPFYCGSRRSIPRCVFRISNPSLAAFGRNTHEASPPGRATFRRIRWPRVQIRIYARRVHSASRANDPGSECLLIQKVRGEEKDDPVHEQWKTAVGSTGNPVSRRSDQKSPHRCKIRKNRCVRPEVVFQSIVGNQIQTQIEFDEGD